MSTRGRRGSLPFSTATALSVALVVGLSGVTASPVSAGPTDTVEITSPKKGAAVGGRVQVKATTTGLATEVSFDWSKDGSDTWQPIGVDVQGNDGWAVTWKTNGYSGPARVRATANSPVTPSEDVISLSVDNRPPTARLGVSRRAFSPNGDGRKDATKLTLRANEPSQLKLTLFGPSGEVRKTWVKDKATKLSVVWGGRDGGSVMRDGRYRLKGKATDKVGLVGIARRSTIIDTKAPKVRWRALGSRVVDGLHRSSFRFKSADRSRRVHVRIKAFDHTGLVDKTKLLRRKEGRRHVLWKPSYANGRPLTPGRFTAKIKVTDDAGNHRISRARKWRVYRRVHAKTYSRIEDAGSRVALTFDDCLESDAWSRILSALKSYGVHATFFCPGQYVYRYPELARQTVREGHSVGSHAWDHALLTNKSAYQTEWRVKKDRKAWWKTAGDSPAPFFRPPYGGYDSAVLEGAGAASYPRVILWDVDPQDWRRPAPSVIASDVLNHVRAGSIVLMHVLDHTATALPMILRGLKKRGLTAVTLHELFRAGGLR